MLSSISVSQQAIVENGLDIDLADAAILDYMSRRFGEHDCPWRAEGIIRYHKVRYTEVLAALPLLRAKPDSIYRRMKELCKKGILALHPDCQKQGETWYAFGENVSLAFRTNPFGKFSDPSENFPNHLGKKSEPFGEFSDPSEKNPNPSENNPRVPIIQTVEGELVTDTLGKFSEGPSCARASPLATTEEVSKEKKVVVEGGAGENHPRVPTDGLYVEVAKRVVTEDGFARWLNENPQKAYLFERASRDYGVPFAETLAAFFLRKCGHVYTDFDNLRRLFGYHCADVAKGSYTLPSQAQLEARRRSASTIKPATPTRYYKELK